MYMLQYGNSGNLSLSNTLLLYASTALLLWVIISTLINGYSSEAIVSSGRIFLEVIFYIIVGTISKVRKILVKIVLLVGCGNSVTVLIQVAEEFKFFYIGATEIPNYLYSIELEFMRKPGFLNGFQVSSLFSLLAIGILLKKLETSNYKKSLLLLILINSASMLFGARTLLMVVPFIFIRNKTVLLFLILAIMLVVVFPPEPLILYYEERILPLFHVLMSFDVGQDYSSRDMLSHYKLPSGLIETTFGNGAPRYHPVFGGKDPTISRWLMQAGIIAAALISVITALVLSRLIFKYGWYNKVLAAGLLLTTLKGELVTSVGVVFLLLTLFPPKYDENRRNI